MTASLAAVGSTAPNLPAIAASVRTLQEQLNDLFPERDELITQLIYGLLTREHVLVFGTFGTGKSLLVDRFFGAFTGGNAFSIELTRFMTESNIVGIPNPKILREEGRIWHERQGTMLDAHFAELDELFDANDYLLRTLLGILNERRFNRGVQLEKANLHMALASTNANPEVEMKRTPGLGAVVDRFLFHTEVKYLEEDESRRRMFRGYLGGMAPTVTIPYHDVAALADAVMSLTIDDPVLIELYNQILTGFTDKQGVVISDRRACQTLKVVKANALLFGRDEIVPDDFLAARWTFCQGTDEAANCAFEEVATPLIEQVVNDRQPDIVRTQMKLLDEFEKRLPDVPKKGEGSPSANKLVSMRRALIQLQADVRQIQPNHPSVADRRKDLLVAIEASCSEVGQLIDGEARK